MKILWLRPSKGDNISVRRERIAEELRQRGYDIDIRDASGTDALGAIKQAVLGDYDVIAGNVRIGLYLGYPLSKLLHKPFLADVSDPISDIDYLSAPLFSFFEWYEWQVLKRADVSVFVYESSYTEALKRGVEHAHRLPNAVDYERFADPDQEAVDEATAILRETGVDFGKPIAIYIGVFASHYKIEEILATAQHAPDWEFVFVGEGELEPEVRQAANETTNIYYPGAFPYQLMPGFLSHANVGFCFKNAEQPLKLKEYGAAGIPIIARSGELSKWHDEDDLVFVDPKPEAIKRRLEELQIDKELYNCYSQSGRRIASELSWEEIAERYDTLFQEIK